MPQSKGRHPHKHAHIATKPPVAHSKPRDNNRVILIAVLFFGFLGLAIGYFISPDPAVLLLSSVIGAAAGWLFGYGIKKSFSSR